MSGSVTHYGYNLGWEMVQCYTAYFDNQEQKLHGLIDSMNIVNNLIKAIADLTNKLAHAKKDDKQIDLNKDELAKKMAYLIHLGNPTIFESKFHIQSSKPSLFEAANPRQGSQGEQQTQGMQGTQGAQSAQGEQQNATPISNDLPSLKETIEEIVEQLRAEGYNQDQIDAAAVLSKVDVSHVSFDILTEEDIDDAIRGLDAETKMYANDLNDIMMRINSKHDDRATMTENARQVIKEASEHIQSIQRRTAGR